MDVSSVEEVPARKVVEEVKGSPPRQSGRRRKGMGGRRVRFRIERHEWYIDMMIQFDGYFLVVVQMLYLLVYLLHGNETLPFGVLRSI